MHSPPPPPPPPGALLLLITMKLSHQLLVHRKWSSNYLPCICTRNSVLIRRADSLSFSLRDPQRESTSSMNMIAGFWSLAISNNDLTSLWTEMRQNYRCWRELIIYIWWKWGVRIHYLRGEWPSGPASSINLTEVKHGCIWSKTGWATFQMNSQNSSFSRPLEGTLN